MSSIPYHDDQALPPDQRPKPAIFETMRQQAFFTERSIAFSEAFNEKQLVAFFKRHNISYPTPMYFDPVKRKHEANLNFWAMVYTAALNYGSPKEPPQIRAKIWLERQSVLNGIKHNAEQGTYVVGGVTHNLPLLLKARRPSP